MTTRMETHQLPLRLPQEDYEDLRNLAFFTGRSMNSIVIEVLHSHLQGYGREELVSALSRRARTDFREVLDKLA